MTEDRTPQVGETCPVCHGAPVYDDAGIITCANCDSKWDAAGHADDWKGDENAD